MNRVLFFIKNILSRSFQITQPQENQITYIRDGQILEPPHKESNCIRWLKTHEGLTKDKSIQCRNADKRCRRTYNPRISD